MSSGLYGATHSEKMPANIITKIRRKLTAPSGCWRTKSSMAFGAGLVSAAATGPSIVMGASVITDARIEHRVEQIDHEVYEHVKRRDEHHHALDQGEVVARDALHEQLADAVEVEPLLGHHEPADEKREFQPDHRDGREQRVAQRVA